MKRFWIILLCVIGACHSARDQKESTDNEKKDSAAATASEVSLMPAQVKTADVQTGKAEMRKMSLDLKVNGKVDVPPQNIVSISFPLGGYLKSTPLLPGMPVKKGQAVAVLEDPQYIQLQQEFLNARIRETQLEKEFNRQKELNAVKASSDKAMEQVTGDYQTQRVTTKSLAQKLALIGLNPERIDADNISRSVNVYSPIDGFVSKVDVNIGKYVSPTEVLFELIDPRDIHLALNVFQKDAALLSIGQEVTASTANTPDDQYKAHIILISRDIDADGTVEVHCHFEKMDKALIPGMFMTAQIHTSTNNAVTVPEEAIVNYDKKQYVFLAQDSSHFVLTEVTIGASADGHVAIISENSRSLLRQQLVLKNAYSLLMKMKNTGEGDE